MTDLLKRGKGQFFTRGNPFVFTLFNYWINKALDEKSDSILLEPFAGSNSIIKLIRDAYPELNNQLTLLAKKYDATETTLAASWILRHPAKMQAICGTTNESRLKEIISASEINLTREEWYSLYISAGHILP